MKIKTNKNNSIINSRFGERNIIKAILNNKGFSETEPFLNIELLSDYEDFELDNLNKAVLEFLNYIYGNCLSASDKSKEALSTIGILVDSDLDGYSSSALLYRVLVHILKELHLENNIEIKCFFHEGKQHGLTDVIIKQVLENEVNFLFIPDASSNDYEQHKLLDNEGVTIIVLDHHNCERYSEHAIVVNNQLTKDYKNKAMSGVGVVYAFCLKLLEFINTHKDVEIEEFNLNDNMDLVAVGIIADSSDTSNLYCRNMIFKGLESIKKNKNSLLHQLFEKEKKEVTMMNVGFYIAPLINAVIRSGTTEDKKELFYCLIDGENTKSVINNCVEMRDKQREITKNGTMVLDEQIKENNLSDLPILILNGTNIINSNYTGLIANKIASKYRKPCLLLRHNTFSKNELSGSGRGFNQSNIENFNQWCKETELFSLAEGHDNAFGVRINVDNIDELLDKISNTHYENSYFVDYIFNSNDINKNLINCCSKYDWLWGKGVEEPVFLIKELMINTDDIQLLGVNRDTIKMKYGDIELMWFKQNADVYNDLTSSKFIKCDIIGKFKTNQFRGKSTPQILVDVLTFEQTENKFKF